MRNREGGGIFVFRLSASPGAFRHAISCRGSCCLGRRRGLQWPIRPPRQPPEVTAAIDRGLGFLAKMRWLGRATTTAQSCHHAGIVIWSMHESKERGFAVDEPVLAEMTEWVAELGEGKMGVRPDRKIAPNARLEGFVFLRLHLVLIRTRTRPSQKGMALFLKTIEGDQTEDGSWRSWPGTRPPMFGDSDENMTALATLALLPAAASGDEAAKAARDKGVEWLAAAKTDDDPQSVALRLVVWRRLGRPAEQSEPLVRRIEERQNADGGWSQSQEMASDAWATGQALYALAQAGIKPDDPALERGRAISSSRRSRDDGSWPMTSRPLKPGGGGPRISFP